MQDTTIMYQGGSGGFLLFYYMLLSGEYITGLDMERIEEYIENQYHPNLAKDQQSWKIGTEHWPNNLECKNSRVNKPKLFLAANPSFTYYLDKELQYIVNDTKIMLMYTDLKTHLRMSYNKKAYWFSELYPEKRINKSQYNTKEFIHKILNSGVMWRGEFCDSELLRIEKIFPNLEPVRLKDLIQNYPKNSKQQWLIDRWLSLHTSKELRHLL